MRAKRAAPSRIPAKYARYRAADWDSPGAWITEREAWNAAQPPVTRSGADSYGNPWAYESGPLGDSTDLMRARREARMTAYPGE